ncbi:hypothetical protein LCGC14_1706570 [marine sediment metagenome]|uniref:TRASH domain-containing protein n=1 Tax=marine sediment metagenome TaxID=412755 RepID=A0A0F9HGW5_9ZZZZ
MKAICYNCEKELGWEKPENTFGLPIFCSTECSNEFPDNGTKEFKERMEKLKKESK